MIITINIFGDDEENNEDIKEQPKEQQYIEYVDLQLQEVEFSGKCIYQKKVII